MIYYKLYLHFECFDETDLKSRQMLTVDSNSCFVSLYTERKHFDILRSPLACFEENKNLLTFRPFPTCNESVVFAMSYPYKKIRRNTFYCHSV